MVAHLRSEKTWLRPEFARIARTHLDRMAQMYRLLTMVHVRNAFDAAALEMVRAVNPIELAIESGFDAGSGSLREVLLDLRPYFDDVQAEPVTIISHLRTIASFTTEPSA